MTKSIYYRRKVLLYLIAAFGEVGVDRLKLQKLLFLFCQGQERAAFDFVPYSYGCFSFQASKDLSVLTQHYRLLNQDENRWVIAENAPKFDLKPKEREVADGLLRRFMGCDNAAIVDFVYNRYPYFSINSEWQMSDRQRMSATRERARINGQNGTVLFTIGYEGRSVDGYLNRLVENNIKLVCDVRKNGLSMKYGFSKNQLARYCESLGIAYRHIPEMGIVSRKRQNLKTPEDYARLFTDYTRSLSRLKSPLNQVTELLGEYKRIALTCFEEQPDRCHRSRIGDFLHETQKVRCQHL